MPMCESGRGVNQTGGRRVAGWLQPENQNNVAVSSKARACGESCWGMEHEYNTGRFPWKGILRGAFI